jgi:TRAP-type C4-dicarboxylate transport system permease large subunit
VLFALAKPEYFGIGQARLNSLANKDVEKDFIPPVTINELIGTFGCIALIGLVIGGIWFGVFTPTEGAGMGALFGLLLALIKGMRLTGLLTVIAETAKVSAPILCLLIFAQMYSRLLALSGTGEIIRAFVADSGLSPELVLAAMFLIWFVLGMFVDSVSIILLTVPIFAPIAIMLGIEPIAFALIGILVIEAGIITPPFGLVVYSVRGCISDPSVSLTDIFKSAIPYWVMLMVLAVMVYQWPGLATWLPSI